MEKKFKNFMFDSAVEICIALYEADSCGDWKTRKEVCARLFARLCRLAKRRHVRIIWLGNDSIHKPDKFIFVKNGREYICNIDGIRYDGVNANCIDNGRYFE